MSSDKGSKDKSKSDGASSDICIVDEDSPNSSGETAWRRSSPATSTNINTSPTFINTPSPISTPSPEKPVSRLKRIIRAPSQPNSPKRLNREIKSAIGKLRPTNKFKFEAPSSSSPNTKFSASATKFTACGTSTPRRSAQVSIPKLKLNTTQPANKVQILENVIIKIAPNSSVQEQQTPQHLQNDLQGKRLSLQNQTKRVEEQSPHNKSKSRSSTPPLPQTQQQIPLSQNSTSSQQNNSQHTPPTTPPPTSVNQNPLLTPPEKTPLLLLPSIVHQQKSFSHKLKIHIANSKKARLQAFIPWSTQVEKQQEKLDKIQFNPATPKDLTSNDSVQLETKDNDSNTPRHSNLNHHNSANQNQNIIPPKSVRNEASSKIPSVFIPHVASIENLTRIIDEDPNLISYSTTSMQDGGIRIKCKDTDSYQNLLQILQKQNILLHTHQKPEDKGLRFVIRNLHASTSSSSIRSLLANKGYLVKYVNVLKNRFTGIPLNMFEVEIDAKNNAQAEQILEITKLGSQEVTFERQARRTDPVQCHRCQAFGHTKNYCRRAFVCLKCAGPHPSTDCKKEKNSPGLCANCGNQHIASYKGCPVFKTERAKLLSVRLNMPPAITNNNNNTAIADHQQPPPQQQLLNAALTIETTKKENPLLPKLIAPANKTEILHQIPHSHQTNTSPPILIRNQAFNPIDQKTYSQVAYEATIKNTRKRPLIKNTPTPSKLPRPTRTLPKHFQHLTQQLPQQIIAQQSYNTPPAQPSESRDNKSLQPDLEENQQIKDIKSAIALNERAILKLSEKVDYTKLIIRPT